MGPKALATTRGLYDAPERRVREAALKAGAWLDDPLVLPHLEKFAESEDPELRRLAAVLMAELLGILVSSLPSPNWSTTQSWTSAWPHTKPSLIWDPRPYAGFDSIPSSKWIWSTAPVL